jgi:hypothetical protein
MDSETAGATPTTPHRVRTTRVDRAAVMPWGLSERRVVWLSFAALALGFVVVGADGLDLGPEEARLGLASGGSIGPLGQVFGYWAPELWPGAVLPSWAVAHLGSGSRATAAVVRWPAAGAAILAGWLIVRGLYRALGHRAAICAGLCWFGCLAVIDRSAGSGVDMLVGVATLAALDRLLARGADGGAGLWAALAFLVGGWPPLALIGLTMIVVGWPGSRFSPGFVIPPLLAAIGWSMATIRVVSTEAWATALGLPLTRGSDVSLPFGVVLMGLPWTPLAALVLSRSVRDGWPSRGRAWVGAWLKTAVACAIAGAVVPGLGSAARLVVLAGLLIAAASALDLAWKGALPAAARQFLLASFALLLTLWLIVMIYGSFICILSMPYYRIMGIILAVLAVAAAILGSSALRTANARRCLVTLVLVVAGLKLAHWGVFVPEWNYRCSQGPWGRAIGQWVPRKWPVYTFLDWPPDLAFYVGRPVRQLRSPRFLNYVPGRESHFVLLRQSEFDHWPDHAPPLTLVARSQDQYGEPRILARTRGTMSAPGQGASTPIPGWFPTSPLASAQ